jgi:hypothetical protein
MRARSRHAQVSGVDCGARGRSKEAKAEQRKRIDKYGGKAT